MIQKYLKASQIQWFSRNKKKVKRLGLSEEDVVVVGIHHRRGDHLDYERVYNIPHITMTYLGPSMDLFLEKFNNCVLFLYVSDDQQWGEEHLARDRSVVVSRSDSRRSLAAGEDLALLSLCQHVISSRGTFSQWAARLAWGLTLRPCMFAQTASREERRQRRSRWPADPLQQAWQTSLWRPC